MEKREIWVYRIPARLGRHLINMVEDAKIVSVQAQREAIAIWVIVNPRMQGIRTEEKNPMRTFDVVMTGEEFDEREGMLFLGTCQFHEGSFILHVFELMVEEGGK